MPQSLLTSLIILVALGSAIKALRSGFYALHMALVAGGVWITANPESALFSQDAVSLFLAWHLASVNLVTMLAYAVDKNAAKKGKWRVLEKQLLALAFIGGTPASWLAQKALRHKTRKASFQQLLWLVFTAQVCVLAALMAG